ncbi:Uncharacterised protein [Legionella beliardensis]|uniref:Transmembrane protein n=1 Tax=Legionella beliardensis TaxID=91822 RepID=A0A378JXT4_9GAMM|nr:hypothetical protein [Legionella beliardensis]STX55561.1 Uncharacterised protein [Legionella beliardensis]
MTKFKAFLLVIVIQTVFFALGFLGFLLDPLIGVWIVGIYFFIVSSFLMYNTLIKAK